LFENPTELAVKPTKTEFPAVTGAKLKVRSAPVLLTPVGVVVAVVKPASAEVSKNAVTRYDEPTETEKESKLPPEPAGLTNPNRNTYSPPEV
jgi:hypothetical protein